MARLSLFGTLTKLISSEILGLEFGLALVLHIILDALDLVAVLTVTVTKKIMCGLLCRRSFITGG